MCLKERCLKSHVSASANSGVVSAIVSKDSQWYPALTESYLRRSCKKKKKRQQQCSGFVLQVLGMRAEPKHEPGGAKHLYCWAVGWSVFCCWLAELSALLLVRRHGENKQLGSPAFISEVSALQGQKRGTKWDTAGSTVDFWYLTDTGQRNFMVCRR